MLSYSDAAFVERYGGDLSQRSLETGQSVGSSRLRRAAHSVAVGDDREI